MDNKKTIYINNQILGVDIEDLTCILVSVLNCLRYITKKKDSGIDYKELHDSLFYSSNIEAINSINLCVKKTYGTLEHMKDMKDRKMELPMIVTVMCKSRGRHSVAIVGHDEKGGKLLVPNLGDDADENMWINKEKLIKLLDPGFNCFVVGSDKKNCSCTKYQGT